MTDTERARSISLIEDMMFEFWRSLEPKQAKQIAFSGARVYLRVDLSHNPIDLTLSLGSPTDNGLHSLLRNVLEQHPIEGEFDGTTHYTALYIKLCHQEDLEEPIQAYIDRFDLDWLCQEMVEQYADYLEGVDRAAD